MRQLAPQFGISKSAADRIIDHLGPRLALRPRKRFRRDTVLIVDGTLIPTRDHTVAEQSKNYRYSTNHQVVIDAGTRLIVVAGRTLAGNRNDCNLSLNVRFEQESLKITHPRGQPGDMPASRSHLRCKGSASTTMSVCSGVIYFDWTQRWGDM